MAGQIRVGSFFNANTVYDSDLDCDLYADNTCSVLAEGCPILNGPSDLTSKYIQLFTLKGVKGAIQFLLDAKAKTWQRSYSWNDAAWSDWVFVNNGHS